MNYPIIILVFFFFSLLIFFKFDKFLTFLKTLPSIFKFLSFLDFIKHLLSCKIFSQLSDSLFEIISKISSSRSYSYFINSVLFLKMLSTSILGFLNN